MTQKLSGPAPVKRSGVERSVTPKMSFVDWSAGLGISCTVSLDDVQFCNFCVGVMSLF